MVVKSATKKKLMDLQIDEEYAHKLADDRKWDDVKVLTPGQIAQICGIDSGTAQRISDLMAASSKSARSAAASTEKTVVRRKSAAARRRRKSMLPLEGFDDDFKMGQIFPKQMARPQVILQRFLNFHILTFHISSFLK